MKNEIKEIKDMMKHVEERLAKLEGKHEFKDGDVVCQDAAHAIIIFRKNVPQNNKCYYYASYETDHEIIRISKDDIMYWGYLSDTRLATPEEAQILFDALAKDGKRWNAETKQIEPIKPEFKAGDFVRIDIPDGMFMYVILISELKYEDNKVVALKTFSERFFMYDTVYYRKEDMTARHMTEAEKSEFLEMIRKAGYQYNAETNTCTMLRWRAQKCERYCFMDDFLRPLYATEYFHDIDVARFNAGNYFQTEAECQAFCDKVKALANGNN